MLLQMRPVEPREVNALMSNKAWLACNLGNRRAAIKKPGVSLAKQYAPLDAELMPSFPPAAKPTIPHNVALYSPAICMAASFLLVMIHFANAMS